MQETLIFTLNGRSQKLDIDSDRMLLWVLRTDLKLTGTKYGCGEGHCGACTVLINNAAVRSCQIPVKKIQNQNLITIEGLANNGKLHPLQKAFIDHDALQCGFCTPGMILNAYGLLNRNPQPSETEIIAGMEDNLCRCGSYNRIINAIQAAAREMQEGVQR